MTTVAQLRRREEAVNLLHLHTILHCKILQLADELAVGQVRHLAAPQRGHAREPQVLDADGVEASAEVVRQLPLPVVAAVGYHFLHAVLRPSGGAAVVAALLLARQAAVGGTLRAEGLLQGRASCKSSGRSRYRRMHHDVSFRRVRAWPR